MTRKVIPRRDFLLLASALLGMGMTGFVSASGSAATTLRQIRATANYVDAEYTERFLQDVGHFFLETAPREITPLLLDQLNRTK